MGGANGGLDGLMGVLTNMFNKQVPDKGSAEVTSTEEKVDDKKKISESETDLEN